MSDTNNIDATTINGADGNSVALDKSLGHDHHRSLFGWFFNSLLGVMNSLEPLLAEVRACTRCAEHLPMGPRPVLQVHASARLLVVGQAPGRKVHETGVPFNDASGDRLRAWLGVSREVFYDARQVAILPMGFCFPGTGKSGDLPPRPECARAWREPLLSHLKNVELTLVIGQYALTYHLPTAKAPLTEVVQGWTEYWPTVVPLPHPSCEASIRCICGSPGLSLGDWKSPNTQTSRTSAE